VKAKTPLVDLGPALYRRRLDMDLTRESAATAIGVSPQLLRAWELGQCCPGPDNEAKARAWLANGRKSK
jgi:transcriptional regulator with XRE-family HTH domain